VLIADDNESFRRTLARLLHLQPDVNVVGEAADGEEACRLCLDLRPDVALLDLMMPKMDGAEAAAHIKRSCPDTKVIIFSVFGQEHHISRALAAGADRYLTKGVSRQEIFAALHAVTAERNQGARRPGDPLAGQPSSGIFRG